MTRRVPSRRRENSYPATYAAIVESANQDHARRIAALKAASRLIIAIEPDLAALVEQRIHYAVTGYSMCLIDCSVYTDTGSKAKWALRIGYGVWNETRDRMVLAFLARGWIVDATPLDPRLEMLILRRPKTQIRICLGCSPELATHLQPEPAKEAK